MTSTRPGPSLQIRDQSGARVPDDQTDWADLALVLGGRAPYWPVELRQRAAILRWQPGDAPTPIAELAVRPDPALLSNLAAILPPGSSGHTVAIAAVAAARHRASDEAARAVARITDNPDIEAWTEVPVTAVPVPQPTTPPEVVRRDGWLSIAGHTSDIAHRVMAAVVACGPTRDLPYSSAEFLDPTEPFADEWAARLRPSHRCAGFEVLYTRAIYTRPGSEPPPEITEHLIDPITDTPAIRLSSGQLVAASAHRLPVTSPLAELVLGYPLWIRLADGTVHLAPHRDTHMISWGFESAVTNALALLVSRLLDDITAPAVDQWDGGGPGLEQLLSMDWPIGTVLDRAELEKARSRG
ncbi:hypothetical protein [Nocardia sp. NBC_01377]|uniref:hypothetical protein n=1 Tax=Nocardia sp. NBC_01377 TaxID=2903595 RepID=UPI00386DC58B